MATTTRLFGSTTTIRSSNFTNLWPRTCGISRAMPGQILQRHSARQRVGDRGCRHVVNRCIRDTHHAFVEAAALFVAQRELRRLARAVANAAGGLFHRRRTCALAAATVAADVSRHNKADTCDDDERCRAIAHYYAMRLAAHCRAICATLAVAAQVRHRIETGRALTV